MPKSPNTLLQRHWRVVQNDKNDWKERVFWAARHLPRLYGGPYKRKVAIAVHSPYQEMDPDNLQAARKPILDALKHNVLLYDDKREWCESTITWTKCKTKKEMRTEIVIQEA